MAGKTFIGVNGVARKPKGIYVGVNGVARKVKAAYVGVNGVARKVWPMNLIPDDRYQSLSYLGVLENSNFGELNFTYDFKNIIDNNYNVRVVYKFKIQKSNILSSSSNGDLQLFRANIYSTGSYFDFGGMPCYYDNDTSTTGLAFAYCAQLYRNNTFAFHYEQANVLAENQYRTNLYSSNLEQEYITNNIYTLDFNNAKKVYLYNNTGYYSISSNNLIGTFSPFHNNFSLYSNVNNYYSSYERFHINFFEGVNIFYSLKMYNGNTLVKDLIPCYRLSDKKVGLYDLVSKTVNITGSGIATVIDSGDYIYSE